MIEPILTTDLIFFFQAEDGIRDVAVTGVQTCALPIYSRRPEHNSGPLGASCGDLVCCGRAAPTGSACWCWQCRCRSWWYRRPAASDRDRKSTRLNSSHGYISYAVFCLKKKKNYYTAHI